MPHLPSFLPKRNATSGLSTPKCTTLLSATPFQGSAGSVGVKSADLSRFLRPDGVAVYVFVHHAAPVVARWGVLITLFLRFCLPPC